MKRLARGLPVVLLLAAVSGCTRHGKPEEAAASAILTPVPPPADLLAGGVVATPDATWQRLQHGVGGGAGLLPTTLGGLVCAATGLDPRLGAEVNGASPAYLVVAGDPASASPSWVVAMRLVEERRARPLFEGATALFEPHDAGSGVVALRAKNGAPTPGVVVGIAPGGWLVLGGTSEALGALAPYATRTLPVNGAAGTPSLTLDVPRSALAGPLATALAGGWGEAERAMLEDDRALREAHGGKAPDFGDPRAITTALDGWVQKRLAALRDLRGLHFTIDVGESEVTAEVIAAPASPGGAASEIAGALRNGDVAPLARVPRETLLALLVANEGSDARAQAAVDLETSLAATLGSRLSPADAARVHTALDDWYGGRGGWETLALTMTPTDRTAVASVAATDPARTSRGVREALDLLARVPAIREPFSAWLHVRDLKLSAVDLPGGGRASLASFSTDPPAPFALGWTPVSPPPGGPRGVEPGTVKLALGAAPLPMLATVLPQGALGDDPAMRAMLGALGPVAGAVVAQPGRSPGCNSTGGVVVGWGTRPAPGSAQDDGGLEAPPALWATVVASDSSLRCAAKALF